MNKMPVDADSLTVTRQKNQTWNREEVEVSLPNGEDSPATATFDAADGVLIHIVAFDRYEPGEAPMSEAEALAVAQEFYDTLPYARGYEYTHLEQYDEDCWSFSFSKPYEIEGEKIYSEYEQVRIAIDPRTGSFLMSNCFYVPLLDDHDPGAQPLTMEQAKQIAEGWVHFSESWKDYDCTATLTICLPEPGQIAALERPDPDGAEESTGEGTTVSSTGEQSAFDHYAHYSVTRPGWFFSYDGEVNGFADGGCIAVDLYTGEILSFDIIG